MNKKFKIDDKVLCINASGTLQGNAIYLVDQYDLGGYMYVKDINGKQIIGGYCDWRFELVKENEKKYGVTIVFDVGENTTIFFADKALANEFIEGWQKTSYVKKIELFSYKLEAEYEKIAKTTFEWVKK